VYACASGDMNLYMGTLKDMHVHLEKHADLGCIVDQTFPCLSAVVFLLVGHYPFYGSPNFRIIKSFSTLFSLRGVFSKGIYCTTLVLTLMNYNVLCNGDLGW
jgi:hypothetical protein